MVDDDEEYCEVCGKHEDDCDCEEYCDNCDKPIDDCECEEDDGPILQDIDKGLDVLNKGIDVWNKLTRPSKIDPSELNADRFKVPPPIDKIPDLELGELPDVKVEKRHKENIKLQKIAIITGAVVAIILGIVAIIFN